MSFRNDPKPTWAGSLRSPRPKGGEWVTKIVGFGRPRRRRPVILADSSRARRPMWTSVYWFGPPEYIGEPESPARITRLSPVPTSTTLPSMGVQPPGYSGPLGEGSDRKSVV